MTKAGEALEVVLRNRLREDLGGTDSVNVGVEVSRIPIEDYSITVSFGCAPERVDELTAVVYEEIARLKTEPIDGDDVASLIETDLRSLETRRQRNGYWASVLETYHEHDEDPREHLQVEERYRSLTADQIQQVMVDYLDMNRRVELILMPEDYAP